jgi:hypothetical protein
MAQDFIISSNTRIRSVKPHHWAGDPEDGPKHPDMELAILAGNSLVRKDDRLSAAIELLFRIERL